MFISIATWLGGRLEKILSLKLYAIQYMGQVLVVLDMKITLWIYLCLFQKIIDS